MTQNPFEQNLEPNPANYQPLTPLTLLSRAAAVFPTHTAIVHGQTRTDYQTFYRRCRQLASQLASKYIGPGDCVSVMLPNTPAMLEAHYGVPMTGAVLHSINTRLDAAIIAFQLDHACCKILIVDREFAPVIKQALALAKNKPMIIDYNDTEFPQDNEPLSFTDYEEFVTDGDPNFNWRMPGKRMGSDFPQLHLGHNWQPQGCCLSSPRCRTDVLLKYCRDRHGTACNLSLDASNVPLQWLVFSLVAFCRGRYTCLFEMGARKSDLRRDR